MILQNGVYAIQPVVQQVVSFILSFKLNIDTSSIAAPGRPQSVSAVKALSVFTFRDVDVSVSVVFIAFTRKLNLDKVA